MESTVASDYPVNFSVDYPDRDLDRLSSALRIFWVIPVLILASTMSALLVVPVAIMVLFRRKYPGWFFNFNYELTKFENRVGAYAALLRDEYPSSDEEQSIHLELPTPHGMQLNRWLPLVKWLLAIPHYFVLLVLGIGAVVAVIIAWFAILFTGRFPRGLFDYIVGVVRWENRVAAYAFLLVTDRYPPFRLRP